MTGRIRTAVRHEPDRDGSDLCRNAGLGVGNRNWARPKMGQAQKELGRDQNKLGHPNATPPQCQDLATRQAQGAGATGAGPGRDTPNRVA